MSRTLAIAVALFATGLLVAPAASHASPERDLRLLARRAGLTPPAVTPAIPRMLGALACVPGRLVAAIEEGAPIALGAGGSIESSNADLAVTLATLGLDRAHPIAGRVAAARRMIVIESSNPAFDPPAAAEALRATGAFRWVTPDYRFVLLEVPDDLFLPYQWYIDDGSFADVRLPAAWDITHGDASVVIAIMDTGVDTGHPDLASRIWHNPGEIAANGIDDDGNGFIDDVEGWDFGVGDNDPKPQYTADISGIDVGFHGTFCAGIASAETNNGDGIAGAGWNSKIMALKVADPVNGLTSEAIAGAFAYAIDEGASIISMSFGGPGDPGVPAFFQDLVDQATAAGILCVAAAGNDGVNALVYPAACNNVLAVAASDESNARASFSNWGPWVDIAAPGSGMWSSISRNYDFTELDQIIYIFFFGWDGVNPYMFGDGTSFACPLTAGVAALVRARFPSLSPAETAAHLVATGDIVAYDHPIGPRLNAYSAVNTGPVAVEHADLIATALGAPEPNPAIGACAFAFRLAEAGAARLALFDCAGRHVRDLAVGPLAAGPHTARWDGRDDRGERVAGGVYFARLASAGRVLERKVVLLGR